MERLRSLRLPRKKAGLFVGGGIAALAIACGGGNATEPRVQNPDTPTLPTASGETLRPPTRTSETSSTVVAPSPESTPTQEAKQEVPCEILPQEFCGQAEVLEYKTLDGATLTMLGFKSLPAVTKIVTPLSGTLESVMFVGEGGWKGWGAIITDPSGSKNIRLIGDLSFGEPGAKSINEGDPVTTIKGSTVENFGYNLLVSFTVKEGGTDIDDVASYEALFPGIASQKPVMTIEQTSEGITLGSYYFPEHESPPPGSQR